ncbi:ZIP family metal transporter [Yoonia sp. 2307UL14-13]|uniref:ZIP family metal transporter n=1 Tax=Yoonia sp. 2307UL14-13 TaxID=3126506 RepID=UPI00309C647B
MLQLVLFSGLAGAMIPLGGWLARQENIRSDWLRTDFRHAVIAFGGGALLSAVVFVLIPEGQEHLGPLAVIGWIAAGAVVMSLIDRQLERSGSSRAQLVAMLADFIPEALALGAVFANGGSTAVLLALMIGLQNLPEGFNAYREQLQTGATGHTILRRFVLLGLIGPAAALAGYFLLAGWPELTATIMLAAAGAILYLVFQDIAPEAKVKNRFGPALGAVAGFLLGLGGHLLIG